MKFDEAWLIQQTTKPGYYVVGETAAPVALAPAPRHAPPVPVIPTLPADRFHARTSKTERRYGQWCEVWVNTGTIAAWWHEPCTFDLGLNRYTPDFLVQVEGDPLTCFADHGGLSLTPEFTARFCDTTLLRDCGLMCIEVKASFVFEERRAYDKLYSAARLFPMFTFSVVQWQAKERRWRARSIPVQ